MIILQQVAFTRAWAFGLSFLIETQAIAHFAYPTMLFCLIAINQSKGFYIFCNNGTGTDHGIRTDFSATDNSGIGAKRSAFFYDGRLKFRFPLNKTPGIDDISKYNGGPYKHIVFDYYAIIKRHIILDLDPISYPH